MLPRLEQLFKGRSVLVTGHTGFKGAWLSLWLAKLGARVHGLALTPDQGPDNLFDQARIAETLESSTILDIRQADAVKKAVDAASPQIVFHLAAQPLVRRSYVDPLETFSTNIMGTASLLEACRVSRSVKAVVCVTTDKVYHNKEWAWPYREIDALGGKDPYSASKAAAELVAHAYQTALKREGGFLLATARGGNVIGGGDWSEDRIVPDIIRALRDGQTLTLRHPKATRPWQHVLDLCLGYMMLAACLLEGRAERSLDGDAFVGAYNFGPEAQTDMPVEALVREALLAWGHPDHRIELGASAVHEAGALKLDSSKAQAELGWRPVLGFADAIEATMRWYRRYCSGAGSARGLMEEDIEMVVSALSQRNAQRSLS